MAVQITVEFTDAQWALVQEHYLYYAPQYIDDEFTGVERETVTQETLAAFLYAQVQDAVISCVQEAARETAVQNQEDLFDV